MSQNVSGVISMFFSTNPLPLLVYCLRCDDAVTTVQHNARLSVCSLGAQVRPPIIVVILRLLLIYHILYIFPVLLKKYKRLLK